MCQPEPRGAHRLHLELAVATRCYVDTASACATCQGYHSITPASPSVARVEREPADGAHLDCTATPLREVDAGGSPLPTEDRAPQGPRLCEGSARAWLYALRRDPRHSTRGWDARLPCDAAQGSTHAAVVVQPSHATTAPDAPLAAAESGLPPQARLRQ